MNDENKSGLSIEMYKDLKETLVKAVKSTKANAGLENAQLERIERLIEAAERSQDQVKHLLEHLQRHTALPGVGAGICRQIQCAAGAVSGETGGDRQGEQADAYVDRASGPSRRSIGKTRHPARTGTPPYLYARS